MQMPPLLILLLGELIPAKPVFDELVKHVANDTGRNENKRGFREQGCNRNSANPCGWCSKSSGKHTHGHILFLINSTYKYVTRLERGRRQAPVRGGKLKRMETALLSDISQMAGLRGLRMVLYCTRFFGHKAALCGLVGC